MCGRFALKAPPAELITRFGLDECAAFKPRYNIPPGTDIPVIRQSPEGKRVLHLLRWGLVPHWAMDMSIGARLNNARGETVAVKPSFRDAFKRRRCLVPASGFYEWKTEDRIKQPYYISLKSGEPMALAGLWESWKGPDGNILRTACIVTTGANALMEPIHERMPVIISPEHWQDWLAEPVEKVERLVAPYPAAGMQAWPVSRRVSKTVDDDAGLIEREVRAGGSLPALVSG
ncbi:MAG: SOS response-associated peptidase [Propionivibrio sp.]|uniref:Abasic site processing protein n=1 Tax=Candidatus Propionivibrio dominans TaxID=2954373 RepID=A0A9D7F5J0_9RHOO|nr:SOS response-associated peptidase [Candidatus Propionivibrio dominans]